MEAEELKKIMENHDETWFTPKDLALKANLNENEIDKTLRLSNLFVKSSKVTNEGENLFSTKEDFEQKTPFFSKILGAFKNRID